MTTAGRLRLAVPRPTGWHLFVLLLIVALGSEYWDKDPLALPGFQLPWPRFVLALSTLPLIVDRADWRWRSLFRVPATLGPLLVFWAACGLSVVSLAVAPGPSDLAQFTRTFTHLSIYVVFVYVVVRWATWPRLVLLVRAYYVFGLGAAALAILQFLHGTFGIIGALGALTFQSAEYEVGGGFSVGFRASSIFGEPSWAARYYVHFIALAFGFWWQTRRRRHLAALVLFTLAFYTANSLLGYVILATFAVAVTLAQLWRANAFSFSQRKKVAAVAVAYGLLLLWLAGMTPRVPDLIDRSLSRISLIAEGAGAVGNRIDSVYAGLRVWQLAPVLGVGLGNIGGYIVPFYTDPEWVLRSRYASDSMYVQLLAETGIVGLAAFLWFWGRLLWFRAPRGFTAIAPPHVAQGYAWLRFLQLDLFAQAVGMLNSSDYLNPHVWTIVAIVLACKTLIARDGRGLAGR